MKLRYTDRSRDDVELAFAWYERQRRGLGFEFLDCVEVALKSIIDYPEMYQKNIHVFVAVLSGDFLFLYFIQLKIMKS